MGEGGNPSGLKNVVLCDGETVVDHELSENVMGVAMEIVKLEANDVYSKTYCSSKPSSGCSVQELD